MCDVLIAAGGTGGHLFPAQALARELLEDGMEVLFVGGNLASNDFFHKSFPFQEISVATPYLTRFFCASWKIFKGVRQSMQILKKTKPQLVVGFGSFHAFPMLLAARLRGVPYVLFESDRMPGKVNHLFAKQAQVCAVQFGEVPLKGNKVEVTVPLWRDPILSTVTFAEGCDYFSLSTELPIILVFGGSQGAAQINHLVSSALAALGKKEFQVLHFVGKETSVVEMKEKYRALGIAYCVKPFEERMEMAWQVAHFAICRAGAMTFAEQMAFVVPAILIPYPHSAGDHQKKNALLMEKRGGAIVLDERDTTPQILARHIEKLLKKEEVEKMKMQMKDDQVHHQKKTLASLVREYTQI